MAPAVPELLDRLQTVYGAVRWRPHRDAIAELVLTILSQHTSDTLSGRAFAELVARFPNWDAVREASVEEIRSAVHGAGLADTKAPRIKAVLQQIHDEHGGYELGFLTELPLDQAKSWLTNLPGVGPKTAACVLMFALGRPALPVDTHVYRVGARLGLVPAKMSANLAHDHLEAMVPPEDVYRFHIGLIKHGRYTCSARRPRCGDCVLSDLCPSAFGASLSA
jgi:endonuclease-3